MNRNYFIILAGGKGIRFKSKIKLPKQFQKLNGASSVELILNNIDFKIFNVDRTNNLALF